ncbi:MAG: pyrrolo-quinoline quinone, partial [Planctomycetes bacterium]|nr:pyrrolo-quinoline quinone [Planctomycetota bacterium]
MINIFCVIGCLLVMSVTVVAGDWRGFRGTDASGIALDSNPPITWSASENVAWKKALPGRGLSSPIVVGDRIFVTASSGFRQDRLHVICISTHDGSTRWERQFTATGRTMTYPKISNAAPTPISDGKRVFAIFSSNDLVCLDLEGQLLWYRGLTFDHPNVSNSLGMASSPVVVDDTLVLQS